MPFGYQYQSNTDHKVLKYFPNEYFSGADVFVYFNDKQIAEINHIDYQMQESVKPVYSYASYTPLRKLHGNRIVSGSIKVNLKNALYIHELMYGSNNYDLTNTMNADNNILQVNVSANDIIQAFELYKRELNLRYRTTRKEGVPNPYSDIYVNRETRNNSKYAYQSYFGSNDSELNDFTIYIVYGEVQYGLETNNTQENISKSDLIQVGADVRAIYGVDLSSVGQVIDSTGAPIEEVYTFLADDIDLLARHVIAKSNDPRLKTVKDLSTNKTVQDFRNQLNTDFGQHGIIYSSPNTTFGEKAS
jgi:hypothetical protein